MHDGSDRIGPKFGIIVEKIDPKVINFIKKILDQTCEFATYFQNPRLKAMIMSIVWLKRRR